MPWVGPSCMIVTYPGHNHLLFKVTTNTPKINFLLLRIFRKLIETSIIGTPVTRIATLFQLKMHHNVTFLSRLLLYMYM